ncbi:hypothetical protein [Psychromonas sp. SR45-3]|uniref:hypothetical protein n=1 Tax=Psychromonas sp. SR45-3 TaxID=2760930 RepID=UPI0015F99246|nr:hypothetical protein [Psychromonas sp. SR45-3]MBB1273982.1 hypothetical protein [Psychromonas sp. SR45-3]
MISLNKLCQCLEELAEGTDKKTENLDSFFIAGSFSASAEKTLNKIISIFKDSEMNPYFHLQLDGEKVELSNFKEYRDNDPYINAFQLTFEKKKYIQKLFSGNGDINEILFISLDIFNNNENGLCLDSPFIKGPINNSTNTRVHVFKLQTPFGGPRLAIVPLNEENIDKSWLSGGKLPTSDTLLKQIHLITNENIIIAPREFQVTWGDLSTSSSLPFRLAYAQHLLIALCSDFYSIDKVLLKGVKHIDANITVTDETSITACWLSKVTECVEWCYSVEDPDVRIQLLIDRLSLDYKDGSLLDLNTDIFKNALEQARNNYKFVIAKKSDEYRKELKNIYSDIQSVTNKFAEKTSLLSSELLKTLLAICFVFTVGTISKAIINNQLLHSNEGLFLFKVISIYLAMSFFIRWLNISADLKISYRALNDWSNKLHSHISVEEVKNEIDKQTFWSKVFYRCSLAFVATVQLSIALAAYYAEGVLKLLGL